VIGPAGPKSNSVSIVVRRGASGRRRLVRAAHDHAELLASETADDVAAAHHRAHRLGELAQHLVADAVAVDVVDALEVVDVEHQHRDRVVRPARAGQLGAQALVDVAVVVEAGEPVCLRLVLEARADVRVVERECGRVREALRQLELVLVELRFLAQPIDVERALEMVARDERDRDQRLGIVLRSARDELHPRIEMCLVRQHGLAVLGGPAGDPLSERDGIRKDLVRPLVAGENRPQDPLEVVGRVDRQRVVRDEIGERVRDPLEQPIQALLGKHVVEDIRQTAVRLGKRLLAGRIGRRFLLGLGNGQKPHLGAPLPLTGRRRVDMELRPQSRLL
jgi:hypothetical protein